MTEKIWISLTKIRMNWFVKKCTESNKENAQIVNKQKEQQQSQHGQGLECRHLPEKGAPKDKRVHPMLEEV